MEVQSIGLVLHGVHHGLGDPGQAVDRGKCADSGSGAVHQQVVLVRCGPETCVGGDIERAAKRNETS